MKPDKKILEGIKEYVIISLGTLVYCMAWDFFIIPNNIASGGLTGLCTILQFATNGGIPVAYSFIIANVILLTIAFIVLGKGVGFKTIYCILLSTVFFEVLPNFTFLQSVPGQPLYISEKVLVPIIGGLMEAVGIGFILHYGGSTGGTDVIVAIINKYKNISLGRAMIMVDAVIVICGSVVSHYFGPQYDWSVALGKLAFSVVEIVVTATTMDFFLNSNKQSVQCFISSLKAEEISDAIINRLHRGCTLFEARGGYSKQPAKVLMVVARKNMLVPIMDIVREIDPKAFVSQAVVHGVYGEGFDPIKREKK